MRGAEIIAGRAMALALKAPEEARQTLRKVDLNIIEAKKKGKVSCICEGTVHTNGIQVLRKREKRKGKEKFININFFFLRPGKSFATFLEGVDLVS
jgi:hypothetical protein